MLRRTLSRLCPNVDEAVARHQAKGTDLTVEVWRDFVTTQHQLIPYRITKMSTEWQNLTFEHFSFSAFSQYVARCVVVGWVGYKVGRDLPNC